MDRYQVQDVVGQGTYGIVSRAIDTKTGHVVALKMIKLEVEDEGIPSTAVREISLLKSLNHENIVKLYDVVLCDKQLTLVFELLDKDLKKYVEVNGGANGRGLELDVMRSFLFQILSGIHHCHENGVIHRDLKPQNLLINGENQLKIADFGLARAYAIPVRSYTNEVVTLWYRAPDILLGQHKYSTPVDMWSVGCIFAEMCTGVALFRGNSEDNQLEVIFGKLGVPTELTLPGVTTLKNWKDKYNFVKKSSPSLEVIFEKLHPEGVDLLKRLLVYNPSKRMKAKKALNHPYLALERQSKSLGKD